MDTQQVLAAIEEMKLAAERKTAAEQQRQEQEQERTKTEVARISYEKHRLRLEQENNALLVRLLEDTGKILDMLAKHAGYDHSQVVYMLQSILNLSQVIALRVGGAELETMLNLVERTIGGNKMQVSASSMTVGNMVEGTQNITGDANLINAQIPVEFMRRVTEAINEGDIAAVEKEINTLPADIVDVAVAAIQGPLVAARMVAKKIVDKWRVSRATGYLKGANDDTGNC